MVGGEDEESAGEAAGGGGGGSGGGGGGSRAEGGCFGGTRAGRTGSTASTTSALPTRDIVYWYSGRSNDDVCDLPVDAHSSNPVDSFYMYA